MQKFKAFNILKQYARYFSENTATSSKLIEKNKYVEATLEQEEKKNENFPGWDQALPFDKIPGDFAAPYFGTLWKMLPLGEYYGKTLVEMHEILRSKYGQICKFDILGTTTVLLFDPNDFEIMFRNEGFWPIRRSFAAFDYYRNVMRADIFKGVAGATASNGKAWHDFRTTVNPIMMQPRVIRPYVSQMDQVAGELIENMKFFAKENENSEMKPDFINELHKWSLESVALVALNTRLGSLDRNLKPNSEAQRLISAAVDMLKLEFKLEILPSVWRYTGIKTPTWKKLVKVFDDLTFITLKYINEAIERIENNQNNKTSEGEHQISVLEKLLKINKTIAIAMAMDMLMGGIDTTGRTLGAALYWLARHPEKQSELRKELLKVMPNTDSPVTSEVLSHSPYLKAVIKETTRITPVLPGHVRTTTRDMVLHGYQIPKGTEVLTSNLLLCHDNNHVPRAKEFLPERWLRDTQGEISYKNLQPFIPLPFGFGPRSCLGKRIANLELETAIAKIVRNFELSWPHKDMTFSMFLFYGIGDPLKLRIKTVNK